MARIALRHFAVSASALTCVLTHIVPGAITGSKSVVDGVKSSSGGGLISSRAGEGAGLDGVDGADDTADEVAVGSYPPRGEQARRPSETRRTSSESLSSEAALCKCACRLASFAALRVRINLSNPCM
jgi:hypothetical protein